MIPDQFMEMARAYRVLSGLKPDQLRKLLPLAEELTFERGQLIFREGGKSLNLHLIISGEVALESVTSDGAHLVQTLETGDAMGWSALIAGSLTHFQARALTPVTTVAFSGERLRVACERDPAVGYALMTKLLEMVTERLDATRIQLAGVPVAPQSV